jgi:hypothetical protein
MGLGGPLLITPQPGEAGGGAQLQRSRLLAPSRIDRLLEPRCAFGRLPRLRQDSPLNRYTSAL